MNKSITLLTYSCLTAALVPAQSNVTPQWRSANVPPGFPSAYKRVTGGEFTGHNAPDVVFVAGGMARLFSAPAIHGAIHTVGERTDVNDVGTLDATTGRDTLLLACTGGLYGHTRTPTGESTTLLTTGAWGTVVTGDLNGDGVLDIAGRNRAGTAVLVHLRGAQPATLTWTFPGESVYEVCCAQWDGSGPAELCVSTNTRLAVRNGATGATIEDVAHTNTGPGLLAKVRLDSIEAVAWLTTSSGVVNLQTVGNGIRYSTVYGNANPVGMKAGAFDTDAYDDLVITHAASSVADVLINQWPAGQSGPFVQTASSPIAASSLPASTANTATAWLGDIDGDGDGEVVMPVSGQGRVDVLRSFEPTQFDLTPNNDPVAISAVNLTAGSKWTLKFTLATAKPSEASHPELLLFQMVNGVASSTALAERFHGTVVGQFATFQVERPWQIADTPPHVGVLRWVKIDNGQVVHAWPPRSVAFYERDDESMVLDWANDADTIWSSVSLPLPTALGPGGDRTTGVIVDPPPPPPPPPPPDGQG